MTQPEPGPIPAPAGRRRRRRLWWAVGVLLGVPVLVVGLLWVFQRKIIYLPDRSAPPAASTVVPGAQDVTLHTSDGLALTAWYVLAPDASCPVTVLLAPGNGGNRAGRAGLMASLAARGYGVLLIDYRGYGGNPGSPTEAGLAADAQAAREFLVQHGVDDAHLIHFGESLGSAVVTRLAATHPPAGTLLRSPFTELADAAAVQFPFLPVRGLLKDRFPVASLVAEQHQPIEVVLGAADSIIPPGLSREVAAAAAGPVHVTDVPGADHNDPILASGPAVLDAVDRLAARIDCR